MPPPAAPPADTAAPADAPARAVTDGRRARGERTRRIVAEALVGLLDEGHTRPTARQVAERAGVSLRLVFHHFDDMEAVLRSAVAVQAERHWRRIRPVEPSAGRPARVARFVRQWAALYEAIAPVRRAAARVEDRSATVAAELLHTRELLRGELARTFAAELAAKGAEAAIHLDMLEAVTGFEAWESLRRRSGHGPAAARQVMARLVEAVLSSHTNRETS